MNLIVSSPLWLMAFLLVVLLAAATEDAIRLRISNITCGLVLLLALIAMGLHGFPLSLWQNVVVCVAILAVGTALFAAGLFGGGDIKLLAAIGLWLNLSAVLYLLIAIAIAGGILAIGYICARKFGLARPAPGQKGLNVPYGLAIVAGALFVFSTQLNQHNPDPVLDRLGVTRTPGR